MKQSRLFSLEVPSPLGPLRLLATDGALVGLYMPEHKGAPERAALPAQGHPTLEGCRAQLEEYFAGGRTAFDIPLAPAGTGFQRAVWNALLEIPYGQVLSYGALAARLGRPRAARAVGAANAGNPISIIVPCHRVVGANGTLTGYAGGVERKQWLLAHERRALAPELPWPADRGQASKSS